VTLAVTSFARLGLAATNASLFCLLIVSWSAHTEHYRYASYLLTALMLTSGLLAGALLATDTTLTAMCLCAVALLVGSLAGLPLVLHPNAVVSRSDASRRLAGGLQHMALSLVATGLIVAGGLLVARYPFNQENTTALQTGLSLLVVGLVMRAGSMPFAGAGADLVESAPQAAILALGTSGPVVIMVGLIVFDGPGLSRMTETGRQVALWLPAIGALLAGLRALAVRPPTPRDNTQNASGRGLAALVASSVALQTGWALFGVFTGSRPGTMGAALLAANMALAVPLMVISCRSYVAGLASEVASVKREPATWKIGLVVGAASLLGLPPSGGFVGALLVAQAAAEAGGWWLTALFLGTAGVAFSWLRVLQQQRSPRPEDLTLENPFAPQAPVRLLTWVLVTAQLLLFVLSVLTAA
jgi:NADH:ubiquinone oxidoreductase subunit 2 (subunit N)